VIDGRFEAIIAGTAALLSGSEGAERQVKIVADNEDIRGGIEFVEFDEFGDGFADAVVEGLGFDKDNIICSGGVGEEFGFGFEGEIVDFGIKIESEKAEIVAGKVIFPAWIAKTDDEFHKHIVS